MRHMAAEALGKLGRGKVGRSVHMCTYVHTHILHTRKYLQEKQIKPSCDLSLVCYKAFSGITTPHI